MSEFEFDTGRFEDQGFMVWQGAVDVDDMRIQISEMLAADELNGVIRNIDGSLRPRNVFRVPAVRCFITGAPLWAAVRSRFMNDPILCSLGVNCVLPGSAGMGIHKDYPYFSRQKQPSGGPLLCLQMILSLDGMNEQNGATTIFPGSHSGSLAQPVRLCCEPGTLILFHGALMHGVERNQSPYRRTNLLASFCPHWVRPFSDLVSDRTPEELGDPMLRHMLGLDFSERVVKDIPYSGFGKKQVRSDAA